MFKISKTKPQDIKTSIVIFYWDTALEEYVNQGWSTTVKYIGVLDSVSHVRFYGLP